MKKVTILSLHLGYGGAERCITNLANSLVDKYNVEILSVYKLYDKPAFNIDKRVNVRYLTDVYSFINIKSWFVIEFING